MRLRCVILSISILSFFVLTSSVLAGEPGRGKQVAQKLELSNGESIEYLLYLPEDFDAQKTYPFMLFLHGRGESYGPLSLVKKWGPPRMVAAGQPMPFIVASPQCPKAARWAQAGEQLKLVELLAHLEKKFPIDPSRRYLTGMSMGGEGAWTLAASHPERFAAVAPICGRGKPVDAEKLKEVPIWAWHGLADGAVKPEGTEKIVAAIREAGGERVIYTSLEGVGHNAWSAAYGTPQLYSWMLSHSAEQEQNTKQEN